jgi:hypothetical protein
MAEPVEARLGPIERVHRIRRGRRRALLIAAVALGLAAVVGLTFAAYRAFVAYTEYGPLLIGRWIGPPVVVALASALAGIWMGRRAWRTWNLRVRLHQNGVAVVRGRRGRALAWPDIRSLWSRVERTGLSGSHRMRLDVEADDGRRIILDDNLEDFESLAQSIKGHVYPRLLAAYTQHFNARQTIAFGPLRLGPEDRERAALALVGKEVRGAQLAGGRLKIQTTRPGKQAAVSIPAHRIPNVELCAQLIQEIGQST